MYSLDDLFRDNQLGHTQFQQDYFITARSGGTTYGMYKQSLRELYKRWRGLKESYSQRELLQIDIDELQYKIDCGPIGNYDFNYKRYNINLKDKTASMSEINKSITETEREFKRFYQQACALKAQIGELTPEKQHALDVEMWEHKIKEMAAIDFISTGRISKNIIELIMCIPVELRHELLLQIKQPQQLIEWIENTQTALPEIELTELTDLPKLLNEG